VIGPIRYKKKERKNKSTNKNTEIVRKAVKIQTKQAQKLNHRRGLKSKKEK
jgi:hypothetical protein